MSMQQTNNFLSDSTEPILRGCLAGDRASQSRLYHLFANKMMALCMWYARNREEAEEILQDGFVRVFRYLHTYKFEGSFEGWVRAIMVSAALSKYRSKTSNMWVVTEYNGNVHDVSVEAMFISRYDEEELMKMIQQLPPACRMVFNLYVFEGYKHREIAKALQISEGTSKSNLSDARKILQNAIAVQKKIENS